MSILSSIVPGLRELRTPLTAGLIWLAAIVTFCVTRHTTLMSHTEVTTQLHHLSTVFAAALATSAIVTGGFLLGNAIIGITNPLLQLTGRYLRKLVSKVIGSIGRVKWVPGHTLITGQHYSFDANTRTISNSARALVMEANARELTKAGVPGSAALLFPLEEAIGSLAFTAPQLSQTAPTQYQEYDRVRSEIAFRMAVVPAIVTLAAVLPIHGKLWILPSVVIAGMILLFQAVGQIRHSNDILANAVYLGYVSIPMVQSVTEYLSQLNPQPAQTGAWIAAMLQGLWQRGFFEESEAMLYEVAELNDDDLTVAKEYLRVNSTSDMEFMLDRLGVPAPSDDSMS